MISVSVRCKNLSFHSLVITTHNQPTGAFMFKSLVSRSSKPKKKRPKRPPRKVKSNKKISTRATDYLRTKGLTDVDRKKIKQQQRGHVMVAKLAAKSRRRMNRQKTSRAKQARRAPYVVVYALTYSNNSNSTHTHTVWERRLQPQHDTDRKHLQFRLLEVEVHHLNVR